MSNKTQYKYLIQFKYVGKPSKNHCFITGYVPAGLKSGEIKKYIQGSAADKKIVKVTKLHQRYYYPELEYNGQLDIVNDAELLKAQLAAVEAAKEQESDTV